MLSIRRRRARAEFEHVEALGHETLVYLRVLAAPARLHLFDLEGRVVAA